MGGGGEWGFLCLFLLLLFLCVQVLFFLPFLLFLPFVSFLGPVHTNAFSKTSVFCFLKTHKSIYVHISVFTAYSTVHTRPPKTDKNIRFRHQSLLDRTFSALRMSGLKYYSRWDMQSVFENLHSGKRFRKPPFSIVLVWSGTFQSFRVYQLKTVFASSKVYNRK